VVDADKHSVEVWTPRDDSPAVERRRTLWWTLAAHSSPPSFAQSCPRPSSAIRAKRLAKVTFYKVGHHGSRNATPKSLWNGFTKRGDSHKVGWLETIVSTMADKYGKSEGAEVPRKTLMTALKTYSKFLTTQDRKGRALRYTVEYDL
jgi:hypothetical protein